MLGKTNLDQFATGLVGTRSPYGAVRDARRPEYVSGGSSSGSAVAVALGLVDLALGTDTAGSGRVPAAFQGVFGVKPSRGLVPTLGVVPACASLDCVTVFARSLELALTASAVLAGPDATDPYSRAPSPDAPLAAPARPRVAVPAARHLQDLSPAALAAFTALAIRLATADVEIVTIDGLDAFFAAGELLYGGAFVAERYAAVGEFIAAHRDACDPVVASLVLAAGGIPAAAFAEDRARLAVLRRDVRAALAAVDALLMPTAPFQPTIAAVAADPVAVNARLGRYTAPANLLDLCALALPAGEADGGHFGVQLLAPAFHDAVIADIAARLCRERWPAPASGLELLVVGAHRRGQPLNGELTARGARYLATVHTAERYRLYALDTAPPKPGLVRVASGGSGDRGRAVGAAAGRARRVRGGAHIADDARVGRARGRSADGSAFCASRSRSRCAGHLRPRQLAGVPRARGSRGARRGFASVVSRPEGQRWRWGEMTWPEIGAASSGSPEVGLVPVGAIEQHGPHLPTGTDTIVASELCDRAAARSGAIAMPAIAPRVQLRARNDVPGHALARARDADARHPPVRRVGGHVGADQARCS